MTNTTLATAYAILSTGSTTILFAARTTDSAFALDAWDETRGRFERNAEMPSLLVVPSELAGLSEEGIEDDAHYVRLLAVADTKAHGWSRIAVQPADEDDFDRFADSVESHDRSQEAFERAQAEYESAAISSGATLFGAKPVLGFDLAADGEVLPEGDETAVARVKVHYAGKGDASCVVLPYSPGGRYGRSFDYLWKSNIAENERGNHPDLIALDDACSALEAWQRNGAYIAEKS